MNRLLASAAGAALFLGTAACSQPSPARPEAAAHAQHAAQVAPEASEAVPTGPLSDASLYQVEARWTDQAGRARHLADFRGRPQLVAMAFTNCANACPLTVQDVKRVLASLNESDRSRVGVVLVSLDPERDTPEALAMFAHHLQLDPSQWVLLRGNAADVRTLAALLGVRYAPGEDGTIAHTNQITVLDRDGAAQFRQDGLGSDISGMLDALHKAL